MNVLFLGAAGFIGKNLAIEFAENKKNYVTLVDKELHYFDDVDFESYPNIRIITSKLDVDTRFDELVSNQQIVFHLISTTVPTTSNQHISLELTSNISLTTNLLDSCVRCNVHKIVFLSSGGTVYGKESSCPLQEDMPTNPINAYGVQKLTIEKLLYLYYYLHGLDYRIVRLANPYGPYQRPNGLLGAVTTFTYRALRNEKIEVYGDGAVIRDFIYIKDAVKGIMKIVDGDSQFKIFNLGSGHGRSIRQVLETIEEVLDIPLDVMYTPTRKVDVPINFLDISRFEKEHGRLETIGLKKGIIETASFMKEKYNLNFFDRV